MLHPVGKLPPAVYWRRRIAFVVVPGLLVLLMIIYLFSGGGGSPSKAASSSTAGTTAAGRSTLPIPPPGTTPARSTTPPVSTSSTPASVAPSTTGAVCTAAALKIQASTGKPAYPLNSRPDLYLTVTNVSATACRQDLGDKQIVLTVMAGDARIWGSHDCKIEPGVDLALLKPNLPVRRGIVWLGQTSAPGCPDNRLVVQAGTYTLTAALAGKASGPVSFTIGAP